MDSWKAREIRIWEVGDKNGRTDPGAKWSNGPGPGVNGQPSYTWPKTGDPRKRDSFTKHQDVIMNGLIPK